jgi:hypothetical protein
MSREGRQLWANDGDMRDELLQSVGEEIEGIGQYSQFLDEANELGDDESAGAIQEALDDEMDHVENFTDSLERVGGTHSMDDFVRGESVNPYSGNSNISPGHRPQQLEDQDGLTWPDAKRQQYLRDDMARSDPRHPRDRVNDKPKRPIPEPGRGLHRAEASNDIVRQFQASGGGALAGSGGGGNFGDDDIAGQARKFLAKTAGRVYSLAEQQELVDESHPSGARNKPTEDDLAGTHYV